MRSKYVGKWAYYPIDLPMPSTLKLFEGGWGKHRQVGTITRYQAMALAKHWGGKHYECVLTHGRYVDIYVIGDIDAWYVEISAVEGEVQA